MGITKIEYRIKIGYFNQISVVKNFKRKVSIDLRSLLFLEFLIASAYLVQTVHVPSTSFEHSGQFYQRIYSNFYTDRIYTPATLVFGFQFANLSQLQRLSPGLSNNKIQSIINGNRRSIGYKLSVWNCNRGLLLEGGKSTKLSDIKIFMELNKPHVYGLIETDLFSQNSIINRPVKFTTEEVLAYLQIDGYSIVLPESW